MRKNIFVVVSFLKLRFHAYELSFQILDVYRL